jgi:hypothetical protein
MSCLPCPSLHSFLAFPDFFRFYHSVQYCYIYFKILVHGVLPRFFLAALYFLTFPVYPLLSVPTLLSCPITSVCVSCLHFSEHPPPPPPAITVLSCSASSYFQSLSCPLQSFLSPVLSVTPDLFHLRTSIQTHSPVYGPGCHCQVLVNV